MFLTAIKSDTNKVGLYPHPVVVCVEENGKRLVLDYAPTKNSSRLLEVKLHMPAEVKILREFSGAKSVVYLGSIAYVCQPSSGIQMVSIAATPRKRGTCQGTTTTKTFCPRLSPRAARETVRLSEELRANLY